MKLRFQPQVAADLRWFKHYFGSGTNAAIETYHRTLDRLSSMPYMGRPVEGRNAREYAIPRIPFSIIYRLHADSIDILRVWDQRADRSALWNKA